MVCFYGAFTVSTAQCLFPRSLAGEAQLHCFRSEFPLQLPPSLSNTSHTYTRTLSSSDTVSTHTVHTEHVQHVHWQKQMIGGGAQVYSLIIT